MSSGLGSAAAFVFRTLLIVPVLVASSACEQQQAQATPWDSPSDSAKTEMVTDSDSICGDCIALQELAVLGDVDGPGYIEWTQDVVRDSLGRYWVGQKEWIKVYDASGEYLRQVGREGEGPLEFAYAKPFHADADGNVRVFDPGNRRESLVGPDFTLRSERRLPGWIYHAAPLEDGRRAAATMWLTTPEAIGLPVHIIDGPDVVASFGLFGDDLAEPQTRFSTERVLTTTPDGHILVAKLYDYWIEAWTERGDRITAWSGPRLNESAVLDGALSLEDNPLPSRIQGIHVDEADRLWVLTSRPREGWRDGLVEEIGADGDRRLVLAPGKDMSSLLRTRLEVIDMGSGEILARSDFDQLLEGFIGGGLIREITNQGGMAPPQMVIWEARLVRSKS